jgi:hypothetical protein
MNAADDYGTIRDRLEAIRKGEHGADYVEPPKKPPCPRWTGDPCGKPCTYYSDCHMTRDKTKDAPP